MATPGPAVVGQPTVSLQGQGDLSVNEDNIRCPCLVCAYKCLGLLPGLMTKPSSQSPLSGLTVSLNSTKRERCGRGKMSDTAQRLAYQIWVPARQRRNGHGLPGVDLAQPFPGTLTIE